MLASSGKSFDFKIRRQQLDASIEESLLHYVHTDVRVHTAIKKDAIILTSKPLLPFLYNAEAVFELDQGCLKATKKEELDKGVLRASISCSAAELDKVRAYESIISHMRLLLNPCDDIAFVT